MWPFQACWCLRAVPSITAPKVSTCQLQAPAIIARRDKLVQWLAAEALQSSAVHRVPLARTPALGMRTAQPALLAACRQLARRGVHSAPLASTRSRGRLPARRAQLVSTDLPAALATARHAPPAPLVHPLARRRRGRVHRALLASTRSRGRLPARVAHLVSTDRPAALATAHCARLAPTPARLPTPRAVSLAPLATTVLRARRTPPQPCVLRDSIAQVVREAAHCALLASPTLLARVCALCVVLVSTVRQGLPAPRAPRGRMAVPLG